MLFTYCTQQQEPVPESLSTAIEPDDIRVHIEFLASDSLRGRETGTPGEAIAANYIADHFRKFGLRPAGDNETYLQQFPVNMGRLRNPHQSGDGEGEGETRLSRNVIGMITGSSQPESYIVVGAHFDHLGMGNFGSLANRNRNNIHNGADDNASGTAGILELAQYFSAHPPQKSMLFVGFSGEEMGLLGSQYFVEHPPVPLNQIEAMINLDMIGRLDENKLLIFGTGSSENWNRLLIHANSDSLNLDLVPDGTGASDHTSFYNKQIPVLHYFTDTHSDYHRPSDDPEQISYPGQDLVLEHVRRVMEQMDTLAADKLAFTEVPEDEQEKDVMIKGVTLGVTPDYGFEGPGMRITGVSSGGPASGAGLKSGDIIIQLDGNPTKDIYEYMEVLNTLEKGETSTVTVKRGDEKLTLDIQF